MTHWLICLLIAFVLSAFLAGFVIPKILLIAFRKKLFDVPDARKIHTSVVPRLGGIAFVPVLLFTVTIILGLNNRYGLGLMNGDLHPDFTIMAFAFCSSMVLFLVGIADDLIGVKYRAKFVAQIIAAFLLIVGGVYVDSFNGVLGLHELPLWILYPFTCLLIVFIINAINLIDGIDGLASGLCSVATIVYTIIFVMMGEYVYALMSVSTFGVLVPFFYYNVFGNADRGRKIFMGDTGALTIGMILSYLSIRIVQLMPIEMPGEGNLPNPIILAFAPLLIPCLDVIRVYLFRIIHKKNPFMPDKNHIHHKLLAMGMSQKTAMMTIVGMSIVFSLLNIWISKFINVNIILVFDLLLWVVFNAVLTDSIKKRETKNEK